ncbi:MAG: methylene-tetrahydromethanopterin dehydrogenase [Rhodospirillaceae bacterium]|jgi:methylene-tetrahydromethanopterin dehydrogenase|nr:methylene-tetrahydromethanopterin dehydrogenase [Rhodospirillaceae bacterium]
MEYRHILHMLSPLRHASPFDVNMAVDAGFDVVVPYTEVELDEIVGLIQDAIFSRGPKGAKATGAFIGGKNAELALDMLDAARGAMVPPFEMSVFADPAGSFTTAAAMVAKVEKHLKEREKSDWKGRKVAVFGGTGVVGFASAIIAAGEGADVVLVGHDGEARVKRLAESAKQRFSVEMRYGDGSSPAAKLRILSDTEIVFAAARAGVEVLSQADLTKAKKLRIVADVNAVPPAGVEGIDPHDDGKPIPGTEAIGIGALAIGVIKSKVQAGLLRKMIESDKPLYLDFRDAFTLARQLVA